MTLKRRFSLVERNEILSKSQQCLWTDDGTPGLEYLTVNRALSKEIIRTFGLGYIPQGINHQLAGRIIFPIYDASNNLIAISSRRINESNTVLPVYWHESYEKSFYLYGLQHAKKSIMRWKFGTVCEGQFDVLQLHNHGMTNAVGLCSTNMSETQISMIFRYCNEVVLLLDKDANMSGQKGTSKALKMFNNTQNYSPRTLVKLGYKITSASFNENTDPDEFVRKHGISALKQIIKKPLIEMRKQHARSEYH